MTADPDVVDKDSLISSWHNHHNNSITKRSMNTIMDDNKKHGRRKGIAMLTTLLALCVICLELQDYGYFFNNNNSSTSYNKDLNNIQRRLSNGGADPPPSSDAISNQYIIKPYVGYSYNQIFESTSETKLDLLSARASSRHNEGRGSKTGRASNSIDNDTNTKWTSKKHSVDVEWLEIDMGIPQKLNQIYLNFGSTSVSNVDYTIEVSHNQYDWEVIKTVTSFTGTQVTYNKSDWDLVQEPELSEPRYARVHFTKSDDSQYSVSEIRVWREPRVKGSSKSNVFCGNDVGAVKDQLLSDHGGTLITLYENSEFFSATMSSAVAASMAEDPCAYAVEPNYIIRARGNSVNKKQLRALRKNQAVHQMKREMLNERTILPDERSHTVGGDPFEAAGIGKYEDQSMKNNTLMTDQTNQRRRRLSDVSTTESQADPQEKHRQLGIPEFNRKDLEPASWGLERISSRGHKNGQYVWLSEGWDTDLYIFDTGIYPDHDDHTGRNIDFDEAGDSRLTDGTVCAGNVDDYDSNNHGTFVASIAAGKKHGVAKSARIHPIQVLDANGEGSIASLLCGMEKLIQDGLDYNAANAPANYRAIVNLSLGVNGRSDILDKAVSDLLGLGYLVVIAAGDNGGNACHYSPYHPDAIVVGSLQDETGTGANDKSSSSNYGECVHIWSPGESIVGASHIGEYEQTTMSGTSVAAAFVSGIASTFLEELLPEETQEDFAPRTRFKLMKKAEKEVLGELGYTSIDLIVQTTASRCQSNSHCNEPLKCLADGVCGLMSDYFGQKKISKADK